MSIQSGTVYAPWKSVRRQMTWMTGQAWGTQRGAYPYLTTPGSRLRARIARIAAGHRAPWQRVTGAPGRFFIGLEGILEVTAGGRAFDLEPGDSLMITEYPFAYQSLSATDTLYWIVDEVPGPDWHFEILDAEPVPDCELSPCCVPLHEARRRVTHFGSHWGSQWSAYALLSIPGLRGQMIHVPPGQVADVDSHGACTVYLGFAGDAQLSVGDEIYPLQKRDALLLEVGTSVRLENLGMDEVLCFQATAA